MMRGKYTFRLPRDLAARLDEYATRKNIARAAVVEAALETFLSPEGTNQLEAALARRLDRLTRAVERLERHSTITNETLALYIRFWLTHTPPLPDTAETAAQAKGRERYEGFVQVLGRRLAKGMLLPDEITREIESDETGG